MLNNTVICGRLTADPELRTAESGTEYLNFSIACERDYKAEGKDRETDFIDIRAFKGTAIFISKYFAKGSQIQIIGRLQRDSWVDKESGKNRSKIVVVAEHAYFSGGKSSGNSDGNTTSQTSFDDMPESYSAVEDYDPDLPF